MFCTRTKFTCDVCCKLYACFLLREDYEWLAESLEEADGSGGIGGDYPDLGVGVQPEQRLQQILLKGGVPHEPSHNVIRHEVVRRRNKLYFRGKIEGH